MPSNHKKSLFFIIFGNLLVSDWRFLEPSPNWRKWRKPLFIQKHVIICLYSPKNHISRIILGKYLFLKRTFLISPQLAKLAKVAKSSFYEQKKRQDSRGESLLSCCRLLFQFFTCGEMPNPFHLPYAPSLPPVHIARRRC